MILVITIFVIALVSFFLTYFSMRNFAQASAVGDNSSLFLISHPHALNVSTVVKLYKLCREKKTVISLERLFKGREQAWVSYLPKDAVSQLNELGLVELEDYIHQNNLVWQPQLHQGVRATHFLADL